MLTDAAKTLNKLLNPSESAASKPKSDIQEYTGVSLIQPFQQSANAKTTSPSLFCIHDNTGLSQTFSLFATKLQTTKSDENPPSVYAFRASGYQEHELPIKTIESIAEEYISQMRRIQPCEPYSILGYKFGALVAFEMARQLKKLHKILVQSLIFVDPDTSKEDNDESSDIIQQKQKLVHNLMTNGHAEISESTPHSMTNGHTEMNESKANSMTNGHTETDESTHNSMTNGHTGMGEHDENRAVEQQKYSNGESTNDFIDQVISTLAEAKQNYRFDTANIENIAENVLMISSDKQEQREMWQKLLPNIKIEQIQANTNGGLLEEENVDVVINKLKCVTLALAL